MPQCQWHWSIHSYRGWQCQWHWSIHSCRGDPPISQQRQPGCQNWDDPFSSLGIAYIGCFVYVPTWSAVSANLCPVSRLLRKAGHTPEHALGCIMGLFYEIKLPKFVDMLFGASHVCHTQEVHWKVNTCMLAYHNHVLYSINVPRLT